MRVAVDLPEPMAAWSMLAAWSAVVATVLPHVGAAVVAPNCARYADGGGSEFDLVLLEGNRAVIVGFDRDFSAMQEDGYDALIAAGAPSWWLEAVAPMRAGRPGPNFAYGYEDFSWTAVGDSAKSIVHATFGPVALADKGSAVASLVDFISQVHADAVGGPYMVDESSVRALFLAGADVDDEVLLRVLGGDYGDRARGIAVARTYRR